MKRFFLFSVLFFTIFLISVAQNNDVFFDFNKRPEVYFTFQIDTPKEVSDFSNVISIDKIDGKTVYAYANENEFFKFLKFGYSIEIQTPPSMLEPAIMKTWDEIQHQRNDWNYYPTYEAYVSMMYQFGIDFPDLCQTVNFGMTNQNRELLACKISSNVSVEEAEPQVLYTSSMHGDEVTGYVLMLRFIDYLLNNYGSNAEITELLDNLEIWICPLANPDGTFHTGDNSVYGATRSNALGVDLNRNYKDFIHGDHPDDQSWQLETVAFMEFQSQHDFVLGINIHGGESVLNYPWDNNATRHVDDAWWQYICREYVDTVHQHSSGDYMTTLNNGITNGYDWYSITGSRQDYTNYYDGNREFTLEISNDKMPNANYLPTFWNYNVRSLINLLKQANFGIQGVITDCETQQPIEATVFIENHDENYSQVVSRASNGAYFRPIKYGTYDVTFSAYGYHPQTFTVTVADHETVIQNVELCQGTLIAGFSADQTTVSVNETVHFSDNSFGEPTSWEWTFFGGNPTISTEQNPSVTYSMEGSYDVMLVITKSVAKTTMTDTMIKRNFITVTNHFIMQNGTFTTCSGLFLDDGGLNNNYSDRKNYQTTFYPVDPTAKLVMNFTAFALENEYDFLYIYDAATNSNSSLIGAYTGNNSPETITATNNEGAFTFVFTSDRNTNAAGWEATISCQGGSLESPEADFSSNVSEIEVGDNVQFTDLSTNNPTNWFWTFEGGTPAASSEQHPMVTYNTSGTYSVTLTVANAVGSDTETKTAYITVHNSSIAPIADFVADETVIYKGDNVQFTDLSINYPTAWQWTFEGGTPATSTEENPTVVYEESGIFSVELTVSNESGSDTKIKTAYITVNSVGIDEEQIENQVSIYPNPTKGNTAISSKNLMQKIEIYNISGQLLKVMEVNNNHFELQVNELYDGLYLIRIYTKEQTITKRLVVTR